MNPVLSAVAAAGDAFVSPWWLPGGHLQTLWRRFGPAPALEHVRQRVELHDGDFLDLDWARDAGRGKSVSDSIALILHGLGGCSRSPYVLSLQRLLADHSLSSVAMNFRGCSGEHNRLARAYHSGVSEDLEAVYQHLSQQYPDRRFVCIGSSLGANVLLKWLSENPGREQLGAAVAVSTPFDLAACSLAVQQGLSRVYGHYFVQRLRASLLDKKRHLSAQNSHREAEILEALGPLDDIRTLWEFDDRVTAPLHGFASAGSYYARCSSGPLLGKISTPTLLVQSLNDPMIPASTLPDTRALPDNIVLQLTDSGGHVGFTHRAQRNWLERRILALMQAD